jgi:hypothetical protein
VSSDSEAAIKYVRKRLYVTDNKAPALSVDTDGYVRCGLSAEMTESDMVVLGLVLALKNQEWKKALVERVSEKMAGATTTTSRVTRAFEMLKE